MGRRSRLRARHTAQRSTNTATTLDNRPHLAAATRSRAQLRAKKDWYRVVTNFIDQPDTAAIYVYDEIGYWGVTAQDFVQELAALKVASIELHINSPGGDVFDGIAIHSALKNHPAQVTAHVDGLAASAASFIAMAANKVVMERNAQLMIHDASGICVGDAKDMQDMADLLNMASDNIADIYAQKAGGSVEDWRAVMQGEAWYSAAEAVDAGLADEVAGESEAPPPDDMPMNSWDLSVFAYAGRENAPAPVVVATAEPAPVDAPETPPEPAPQPEIPAQSAPVDVPEPIPEPEPVEEPEPEPEPAAPVVDEWATLTAGLLTPKPAPPTVDGLLAALRKEMA